MVIQSTLNYKQYKGDIKKEFLDAGTPQKNVNNFMKYFSSVYDIHGRAYFDYKLACFLYNKRQHTILSNNWYWVALVGKVGGEGKSTLAKQILYFLDPTFKGQSTAMALIDFVECILERKQTVKYPGILLDEMETEIHALSKEGRRIRDAMQRGRQLNLFIALCTNDLSEIPTIFYDKISTIIYLDQNHRANLWDNQRDKRGDIVNTIKYKYKEEKLRHDVFKLSRILKRSHFKKLEFSKTLPFKEAQYKEDKEKDVLDRLKSIVDESKPKAPNWDRDSSICMAYSTGAMTRQSLANAYNLSKQMIDNILKKGQIAKPKKQNIYTGGVRNGNKVSL